MLGLHCCVRAFSSCGEQGLLFGAVRGLLIAVASLCCGARALEHRLSSRGAQAQSLRGMWDPPGPGLKPVSPALAGGFLSTAPPGKPYITVLDGKIYIYIYIYNISRKAIYIYIQESNAQLLGSRSGLVIENSSL